MASSEHLKAPLHSHLNRDDDQFLSITLQVAAHEASNGHGRLAQELHGIIAQAKKSNVKNLPVSIAKSLKDSDGLLAISNWPPQV